MREEFRRQEFRSEEFDASGELWGVAT